MKPHSFSNSNYSNFLNFNIECNKTCRTKAELLVHLHKHSGNLPECWECGKKCASFSNLVSHVQLHTGEKPYTCQFCGKQFTQDAHLTRHLRLHTGKQYTLGTTALVSPTLVSYLKYDSYFIIR